MTLADFRGRFVLLNVWATWCLPCRKEMPALDHLQAVLGGPGFEVVALSIDRGGSSVVQKFYQELGIKALGIYLDASDATTSDLKVPGIPTTLLVDREGRETGRKIGPATWDSSEAIETIRGYIEPSPEIRAAPSGEPGKP